MMGKGLVDQIQAVDIIHHIASRLDGYDKKLDPSDLLDLIRERYGTRWGYGDLRKVLYRS